MPRPPTGPLSLISVGSSERRESVKGARFLRGLRTLDRFCSALNNLGQQGKGAGGLRGLAPWRSLRQRLIARVQRAAQPRFPCSSALFASCHLALLGLAFCYVDFRAIVAILPSALCLQPSPRCPLVFSIQGVLPSQLRSVQNQSPGSRRSAATSQSPQLGAFAYPQNPIPRSHLLLCRYSCLCALPLALRASASGCTADRKLLPSPTTGAATPPVSAPPPRSLFSSLSCLPFSLLAPSPTPANRCPAPLSAGCSALLAPTDFAVTGPPPC